MTRHKKIILGLFLIFTTILVLADTPPPGVVKSKTYSGDGLIAISATSLTGKQGLDVNVINSTGGTVAISGTVGVTQSTSPWVTSRNWDLDFSTDQVNASGSTINSVQSGSWTTGRTWNLSFANDFVNSSGSTVSVSSIPAIAGTVTANQGTSPWLTSRDWSLGFSTDLVNASGSTISISNFPSTFGVTQSTSPWVTSRNWTESFATDSINASGSTVSVSSIPAIAGTVSISGTVGVTQSTSPWVTSRNWTESFATDSINTSGSTMLISTAGNTVTANQGTSPWVTSRNWNLSFANDFVNSSGSTIIVSSIPAVSGTVTANTSFANNTINASGSTVSVSSIPAIAGTVSIATAGNTVTAIGDVANAATDSGNPVKVGGIYNSTPPTYTNGQRANIQVDSMGNQKVKPQGRISITTVRNDYTSVNVTTSAYVQLIASTSDYVNNIQVTDTSGQTLKLAVGAAAAEVDQFLIPPYATGGIDLYIPTGSRVSIKAVSATANTGEIDLSFLR